MTLDASTRNRLQKTVTACRRLLTADFNLQLQRDYGIYADEGKVFPLEKLVSQDDRTLQIGRLLRERIDHLKASEPEEREPLKHAVDRVLREQAFTVLNRFAALRMAEERGLIQLSVGKGFQSDAFLVFDNFAGAALGSQYDRYRLFFSCLVDELSLDLGVLFDRHSPFGLLFPSAEALGQLFDALNAPDIRPLWKADETIGWIYQYYNDEAERKKMRESAAPRNSRELAVRNQFFTPRYVVEFLTDNTLGRIWYEMRRGNTSLKDQCHYLVRQPMAIFLNEGQSAPEENQAQHTGEVEASKGDILRQPVCIPFRPLKDPREIGLLDPACGSMHFGLYAFDLLEIIYREAWDLPDLRQSLAEAYGHGDVGDIIAVPESVKLLTQAKIRCFASGRDVSVEEAVLVLTGYEDGHIAGRPLVYHPEEVASRRNTISLEIPLRAFKYARAVQENWFSPATGKIFLETAGCFDFQTQPAKTLEEACLAFQRDIPRLIIERNIHGIDIDPRCAQIAGLSLWLRAQKSWQDMKLRPLERPVVRKSNIVCAEPMPGEKALLREFVEQQFPAGERPTFAFLLETIFDRMTLAGEVGSLLRIEEVIRTAVADAKRLWKEGPKAEQAALFSRPDDEKGPSAMRLDLSGITDEQFWERAEQQIYDALEAYAAQAENGAGFQRRLFADDAVEGFAFVDLCRKRYDVVVMNPPFGAFSKLSKPYVTERFPNSSNDIFAAFVECYLSRLTEGGLLGAITSRTGFFIASFADWRREVIQKIARLTCFADLGGGVMDNATVEAAAYIFHRSTQLDSSTDASPFIRLLADTDKRPALSEAIRNLNDGKIQPNRIFWASNAQFRLLPDLPFVYWANPETLEKLMKWPAFEPAAAQVRKGLRTGDNFRFVRVLWEIPTRDFTPAISAEDSQSHRENSKWVPLVLGGSSQPWFSPLLVALNWQSNGKELRQYVTKYGSPSRLIQAENFYFRAGISWTRRAARFIPYAIPSGCIPTGSRPMAFPISGLELSVLAVSGSRVASAFMRFYGDWFTRPNFLEGKVKLFPWPELPLSLSSQFDELVLRETKLRRSSYRGHEPFFDFIMPFNQDDEGDSAPISIDWTTLLGSDLESSVERAFGLEPGTAVELCRDLDEALSVRGAPIASEDSDDDDDDGAELLLDCSKRSQLDGTISYAIGCTFGRWDIRYATGERQPPELQAPFDPLPVCAPGMLQNASGFPAEPIDISSDYPLHIAWSGILVDDENHAEDIVARVRECIEVIWKDRAEMIEQEACEILGVKTLRDYFRRPAAFFADHLKRYSKSRRQAPIYWPLSTTTGSYTLWLYYHRLDEQTLFQCINRFIDPKLASLEKDLGRLRGEPEDKKSGQAIESADSLRLELEELKAELLRVVALPWKPDQNDGVLITASPLWRLFRLPKWQKDLKACWQKLEAGEYDWAHLAYAIRRKEVQKACESDRSIAIAHGLEDLCKIEAVKPKKKRGKISAPGESDEVE